MKKKHSRKIFYSKILRSMGPGIITGAADDDPSGIATYSIAGAQLGTSLLWTAWITWPLMFAVQMMCARIGMVTGEGLSDAFKKKFPKPLLIVIALALLIANTLNIGADLAAMADAAAMMTKGSPHFFLIIFAIGISLATVWLRYSEIARVLKWLALILFSYIIVVFIIGPNWGEVLHDSFIPSLPSASGRATLVAILGTTISPYLFFWQTSQEVEEDKALGHMTRYSRIGTTSEKLFDRKIDVGIGTFFSNLVMFFIILATAITLHKHGLTNIETSQQAAEALRPLAGKFAATLYTLGILGVGFLAIPTLTGSAAYALAETFHRQGLDLKLKKAKAFYAVIVVSTVVAVFLNFLKINPVQALYWSAVVNGLLAPFLLVGIVVIASDSKLMHQQPSSKISSFTVALTALVMFGAALGMFFLSSH